LRSTSSNKKGVYVLAVEAHGEIEVGRLGHQRFDGLYLYVGSALGPGGLKRIERHLAVAQGRNLTGRWHVDYLLGLGVVRGVYTLKTTERLECALAQELGKHLEPAVSGFGSSDCRCKTHLFKGNGPWNRIVPQTMGILSIAEKRR
jgi:Uri superfamily endonuclease